MQEICACARQNLLSRLYYDKPENAREYILQQLKEIHRQQEMQAEETRRKQEENDSYEASTARDEGPEADIDDLGIFTDRDLAVYFNMLAGAGQHAIPAQQLLKGSLPFCRKKTNTPVCFNLAPETCVVPTPVNLLAGVFLNFHRVVLQAKSARFLLCESLKSMESRKNNVFEYSSTLFMFHMLILKAAALIRTRVSSTSTKKCVTLFAVCRDQPILLTRRCNRRRLQGPCFVKESLAIQPHSVGGHIAIALFRKLQNTGILILLALVVSAFRAVTRNARSDSVPRCGQEAFLQNDETSNRCVLLRRT